MSLYLKNVSTLRIDEDRCVGCGRCVTVCPQRVWRLEKKRAAISDVDACMECGACALNCAEGAIDVRKGVGCAAAIVTQALGRSDQCC